MKYAMTTFSCPDASLPEVLEYAVKYGYDGVELRAGYRQGHGVELERSKPERERIRSLFATSGVEPCCLSVSCSYANADTVDEQIRETIAYAELAKDLHIPFIRVFCGMIPADTTREEAFQRIVSALKDIAPHAASYGVYILAETHDDWSDPQEMAAIMRAVNHPHVAVVWDIMHTLRTGGASMEDAYRILAPWVKHVHIHDGSLRTDKLEFKPIGEGDFDHKAVLRILREAGYNGYLSGEWLNWEPPDIHLPRELKRMKAYERELDELERNEKNRK